jgi:uncharacterized protein YdiU (UPF0061 family)
MFYDGRPQAEPGAIVCRVAPSFVRFGNFQILAAERELDNLKRLADYVIGMHFPELGAPSPATYARWLDEISRRTAVLMVEWMRVGFVHGVMNTDNMSILGLTIDYGPYGWLEGFDPQWTPNTTDAEEGRYRYGNQPQIALWNLAQFAHALAPLLADEGALERSLAVYRDTYEHTSRRMLAAKLGLRALDQDGDDALVADLFDLLEAVETDMTLFFRGLAAVPLDATDDAALIASLRRAFYDEQAAVPVQRERLVPWLRRYAARAKRDDAPARVLRMNSANPKYVLRNYLAQQAIDALERGDTAVMARLMAVLQRPYDDQPEHDDLAERRPEWARHRPGCSALSCSS